MTANAMSGDRENCLAAGMNDHVPKPVDPQELFSVLLKWVKPKEATAMTQPPTAANDTSAPSPSPQAAAATDELPESIPGIDVGAVVKRLGGNKVMVRKLLVSFAKNHSNAANEVTRLIGEGDIDTAHRIAHTLKGTAGTMGIMTVFDSAKALDTALQNREVENYEPLTLAFKKTLDEVVKGLQVLL
jgi:HPt (histidine-containing phosphotransfer) domain-containing protein